MLRKVAPLAAIAMISSGVYTAETEEAPAVEAPKENVFTSGWFAGFEHRGNAGAYYSSTTTGNAEDSRDSTIQGTNENITYNLQFDGRLWKDTETNRIQHDLKVRFGQSKSSDEEWEENSDELRYDGQYDWKLKEPGFLYGAWGFETVFTGTEANGEEPFDPFLVKASAGYGQRYNPAGYETSEWTWRVGARVQKRWGRGLDDHERDVQTGYEFITRYEAAPKEDLTFWAQYELFGRFEDPGHITNLLTAALEYRLMKYLKLKFEWRLYYETEPDYAESGDVGYDEISWSQLALVGASYEW